MPRNKKSSALPTKYIGIAIVILAIIGLGTYQYTKEDDNLPTSAIITVNFADGTTKTFDSNTMAMGALYNPQTNTPVSSITVTIKIKPVVQTSDGSYPTSLPSGYSVVRDDSTNMCLMVNSIFTCIEVPSQINAGGSLVPNAENVLVSTTLTPSSLNQIDTISSGVTNGNTFQLNVAPTSLNLISVKLIKPDGTSTTVDSTTPLPTISMLIKKVAALTYTLQGVTVSGEFS